MKWEYDPGEVEDALNKLGKEGWELVSVSPSLFTYTLKRPLAVPL